MFCCPSGVTCLSIRSDLKSKCVHELFGVFGSHMMLHSEKKCPILGVFLHGGGLAERILLHLKTSSD